MTPEETAWMTRWLLMGRPVHFKASPRMLYEVVEPVFDRIGVGLKWTSRSGTYHVGILRHSGFSYIVWTEDDSAEAKYDPETGGEYWEEEPYWEQLFYNFESAREQLRWLLSDLVQLWEAREEAGLSGDKDKKDDPELYKALRHALHVPVKQRSQAIPSKKEKSKRRKGRRKGWKEEL